MGNRKAGPGESVHTRHKERFFGLCLGFHIKREARHLLSLERTQPYYHVDLNAGTGYNAISNTVGTPILFMRQAEKHRRLAIEAVFIESNPLSVEALRHRIHSEHAAEFNGHLFGLDRHFRIIRGDNEEEMHRFVNGRMPTGDQLRHARGSIISDPNGWSRNGGAVSMETLRAACAACPNMLVLIFFQHALARMNRGYKDNDPTRKTTTRMIRDFLPLRQHWLVSEKYGGYVYLCGTRVRMPEGTKHVPAWQHDSPRGREIIADCDTIRDRSKAEKRRADAAASSF